MPAHNGPRAFMSDHDERIAASREWGNFLAQGYGLAALDEARRILAETEPRTVPSFQGSLRLLPRPVRFPERDALAEALSTFIENGVA